MTDALTVAPATDPGPARDARGRYLHWSRQRTQERRDLGNWKQHKAVCVSAATRAMKGDHLLLRVRAGTAYPFPIARATADLRAACHIAARGRSLSDGELVVLAWIAAVNVGHWRDAMLTHAQLAELAGCSERTAGARVRHLVALGVLERHPHFQPIPGVRNRHLRGPSVYRVAPWVRELLRPAEATVASGSSCQAGREHIPLPSERVPSGHRKAAATAAIGPLSPAAPAGASATATAEAPERVGPHVHLGRVAARLTRELHGLSASLVEEAEARYKARHVAAWRGMAAAVAAPGNRSTVARDVTARGDDRVRDGTVTRLVAQGLFSTTNEALSWWRDAATHLPKCGCGVCVTRSQVARELRGFA